MEFIEKNPVLLLVDIQKAFLHNDYPGKKRNNHTAELICGKILKKWRELGLKVIHVRHSSTNPDSMLHKSNYGFEFNDHVRPISDELILTKNVNSAFIGTGLTEILKKFKIKTIVIVGMTTNHCISTTVRMSGNLGYETYLISDSTACFNTIGQDGEEIDCEIIYKISLANLKDEFAKIISSKKLFELLI